MPTREEAIGELERERNVRVRIFDTWVQNGKLTAIEARDRMDRICAAIHFLKADEVIPEEVQA